VYFVYPRQVLAGLVRIAFGLEANQISIPKELDVEHFDVNAKAPDGTTAAQVKVMWQTLLADRFHLVYHRESIVMPVWELTVAKSGVKMLDSSLGKADDPRASPLPEQRQGGPLWFAPGKRMVYSYTRTEDGVTLMTGRQASLAELTFLLEKSLRQPGQSRGVLDKTGLGGTYDFGIQYVAPNDEGRPHNKPTDAGDIFTAVEQYLGLKLENVRRPVEVLVVDKADRVPTEN
jgi:uncharacterized protein (TIGR03435 family)